MKKRMLALLAVLCCVALVAALFVACNNGEKGQTNNTGVTTPADDDAQQGGETPDDEGQGGETPDDEQGGDTQDPADPDEGEEDPDEDINESEPPDEGIEGPENPGEDEGLAPPTTIDDLFPDNTDNGMTDEEFAKALNDANEYKKIIIENLNSYLYETIALFTNTMAIDKIENAVWRLMADENDSTKVKKITIQFNYKSADTNQVFYVRSVVPKNNLTFAELYQGDAAVLESAFEKSRFGGAKYTTDLSFSHNPSIQESSAALTEALKNVAIKDGDLEIEIDESAEFYIKDRGSSIDTILKSEVRYMELFVKTDFGYQQIGYSVAMVNPSWNIETLVKQVESGKYRSYFLSNGKGEFTGHIIYVADNVDADAVGE